MEWNCPHCQTDLATPELREAAPGKGPGPGWSYARCFQCGGFASVDLTSGHALKIEKPAKVTATYGEPKEEKSEATPPPYLHQDPEIVEAGAHLAAWFGEEAIPTIQAEASLEPPSPKPVPRIKIFAMGLLLTASVGAGAVGIAHLAAVRKLMHDRALAAAERVVPKQIVTDSIHASAMAPIRPEAKPLAVREEIRLSVQAREGISSLELREGPGPQFGLVGLADRDERFPVIELKGRWFKIPIGESGRSAWVSRDRVEVFSNGDGK